MTAPVFKTGKAPARKNAIKLALKNYVTLGGLPTPPKVFGHQALETDWGMLGNDQYGDCFWAGSAHETMLWNVEAGHPVSFTDVSVLSDYAHATGFDPTDSNTDQGTDMQQGAAYRTKFGILDAAGNRHIVDAYVDVPKRSTLWVLKAAYVFGAVGVGIRFPETAMDQFNAGKPWSYVPFSRVDGGHYIPVIGRAENGNLLCVTWGRVQEMTPAFFKVYNDESVAYLSLEGLRDNTTIDGFNIDALRADLQAIKG